jgi:hypothetical protein
MGWLLQNDCDVTQLESDTEYAVIDRLTGACPSNSWQMSGSGVYRGIE